MDNQLQNLPLSRRELVVPLRATEAMVVLRPPGYRRIPVQASPLNDPQGLNDGASVG